MANQEILCAVNTCYYNEAGRKCKAEKIMVQFNPDVIHGSKMEIGEMGHDAPTHKSTGTLCQTFIPKEQGPKAGIARLP